MLKIVLVGRLIDVQPAADRIKKIFDINSTAGPYQDNPMRSKEPVADEDRVRLYLMVNGL